MIKYTKDLGRYLNWDSIFYHLFPSPLLYIFYLSPSLYTYFQIYGQTVDKV